MSHTTLERTSSRILAPSSHRSRRHRKLRLVPTLTAERKRQVIDKLKAIGEEVLCWLFLGAIITVVVLLFSSLS